MICHQDIGAINENEFKKKTDMVLNILKNAGMTINEKKKCVNNCSKISFLIYSI